MLAVVHTVEESSDTLAFATEPVLGSLANVFDYLEDRLPQGFTPKLKDYDLLNFEIKYGLLQVSFPYLAFHFLPATSSVCVKGSFSDCKLAI